MKVLFACLLFGLATVAAADTTTWVDVTRVEPVVTTRSAPSTDPLCRAKRPAKQQGLAALLEWDLLADCTPVTRKVTTHYRVYYTWAGREYSYTSSKIPGNRIALNVVVDPV